MLILISSLCAEICVGQSTEIERMDREQIARLLKTTKGSYQNQKGK